MTTEFPPKRILVAMDGSEESLAAWEQAEALGSLIGAHFEGLYVQPWLRHALGLGTADPEVTAKAEEDMLAWLKARLGDKAQIYSFPGDPVETVLNWASSQGFDLIVMGTHGRSGLGRAVRRSVAEAVVHASEVPVLVCRRVVRRFRSVLAPYNFMPYAVEGLAAAAEAAEGLGAQLVLLTALKAPSAADKGSLDGMRRLVEEHIAAMPEPLRRAVKPSHRFAFGDPAEEIVKEAASHDLVVLTAHVSRLVHDWVLGTTAERVLRYSPAPVLAVPSRLSRKPGVMELAEVALPLP